MRISFYCGLFFAGGCLEFPSDSISEDKKQEGNSFLQEEEIQEGEIQEEGNDSTLGEGDNIDSEENPNGSNQENPNNNENNSEHGVPIAPDFLIYTFSHGYQNGQVCEVNTATGITSGQFTAFLYDSIVGDYCAVNWDFDASTVEEDPNMNGGSVYSVGSDETIETWFGFIITSQPYTSGNCNFDHSYYQEILDIVLHDQPGFGYGPLTTNLESYLNSDHTPNWNEMENYVFSGIVSTYLVSEHGERGYLDINQAYAYPITNGETTWSDGHHEYPQGSEIMTDALPSDAHYVSIYYFGLGL